MLTLLSEMLLSASLQNIDNSHQRHARRGRPRKTWEVERLEAERRRRAMSRVGQW